MRLDCPATKVLPLIWTPTWAEAIVGIATIMLEKIAAASNDFFFN